MTEEQFQQRLRKERVKTLGAASLVAIGAGFLASSATYYLQHDEAPPPTEPMATLATSVKPEQPESDVVVPPSPQKAQSPNADFEPTTQSDELGSLSNRSSAQQTAYSVVGDAPQLRIRITERDWENTEEGLRPRLAGEISLPENTVGSHQVEFWANVSVDGEAVGYDNLRVTLREGQGRFEEVFFLYEGAPTFRDQPLFDLSIENIVILRVPEYELHLDDEPARQSRSPMLTENR